MPLVERVTPIAIDAVLLLAASEEDGDEPTAIASIAFRCAKVKYRDDNGDDELLPVLY